ncbi:MAG: sulfatase [Myxococcota bacterium]
MSPRTAAVLLLGATLLAACGSGRPAAPTWDRVVFVTLDTLRADHLGAYGYPRPTSPFLDSLAERGVVFERAYAPMSTTAPSHATMFTGLYPLQHGIERNGQRLPDGVGTLAQQLRGAGVTTAAFVSTRVHFQPAGLHRGFRVFDRPPREPRRPYRPANETVEAARRWLAACGSCERLFLWIHLFDVHDPHQAPAEHREALAVAPSDVARLADFYTGERGVPADYLPSRALVEAMAAYDAEIRFADQELSRLYETVSARLPDPVLWIVTADHGEGLGNHGWRGHGKHIYEEQVRVPLIVHASDGSLVPGRVDGLVEHTDVLPSVLELMVEGAAARPAAEGRSFVPALAAAPLAPRTAFVQRRTYAQDGPSTRETGWEPGLKFALVEPRWKFVHHTAGGEELFDLERDPYELDDRIHEEGAVAARLREALQARLAAVSEGRVVPESAATVDEDTLRQLEELGYVQ